MIARSTISARFWDIPPTPDFPFRLCIIQDERGLRTFDDSPDGSHPITNPELLRLLKFKIYLSKIDSK